MCVCVCVYVYVCACVCVCVCLLLLLLAGATSPLQAKVRAKRLKHLTVDQRVPGLNPTCCFTGKVFSLPLLPLGDQPLAEMVCDTAASLW